jgi:predicted PilT family ATPase
MVFGQVVIGPPGSGKTTYCNGMSQFLSLLGRYVRRLVPHYCFG